MALAALDYAKLGSEWYVAAYVHACNTRNLIAHTALDYEIPQHRWTAQRWLHRYKYLRVFGCPAYVTIPTKYRIKHQTKAWKGMFIGIGDNGHSFKIWNPAKRKHYDRRNVTFDENWMRNGVPTVYPQNPDHKALVSLDEESDDLGGDTDSESEDDAVRDEHGDSDSEVDIEKLEEQQRCNALQYDTDSDDSLDMSEDEEVAADDNAAHDGADVGTERSDTMEKEQ